MTPDNMMVAATIDRIFPEARYIHSVRHGLDVASSVVPLGWGPNNHRDAIRWWATKLLEGSRELSWLPDERLLTLRFEDLVRDARIESVDLIAKLVGVERAASGHDYLEREVTAERSHLGRWKTDLPAEELDVLVSLYEMTIRELIASGVSCI